ncbi:MAG: hypothetical protein MUD17_13000 [Gemmatimonadaceae bacterium]|nr:hypothetical protein [Gemmatimonadaceae bacterium]
MRSPSAKVCLAREKAFRVALRMRIDKQMQTVRHLPCDGMTARSDRMFKPAMHLCYLFQQRRKAAQYLFGGGACQCQRAQCLGAQASGRKDHRRSARRGADPRRLF